MCVEVAQGLCVCVCVWIEGSADSAKPPPVWMMETGCENIRWTLCLSLSDHHRSFLIGRGRNRTGGQTLTLIMDTLNIKSLDFHVFWTRVINHLWLALWCLILKIVHIWALLNNRAGVRAYLDRVVIKELLYMQQEWSRNTDAHDAKPLSMLQDRVCELSL